LFDADDAGPKPRPSLAPWRERSAWNVWSVTPGHRSVRTRPLRSRAVRRPRYSPTAPATSPTTLVPRQLSAPVTAGPPQPQPRRRGAPPWPRAGRDRCPLQLQRGPLSLSLDPRLRQHAAPSGSGRVDAATASAFSRDETAMRSNAFPDGPLHRSDARPRGLAVEVVEVGRPPGLYC